MKIPSLLIFLLFASVCHGQWTPYRFPSQIDSLAQVEDGVQSDPGTEYSWIGNYRKALEIFGNRKKTEISPEQKALIQKYHPVDAEKYILQRAKKAKVVIINEAHHVPMHRVFMESLLKGLRDEGFDMLGMETFMDQDSAIQRRGYPTVSESGYYAAEPCYGNMIRKALSLKYQLFGYETNGSGEREINQADNIIRMIKEHPHSKFVIYCGYAHLIKDTIIKEDGWRHAMAGWLRLKTGIDALTIDQVTLTETGVDSFDDAWRRMIHEDKPVIMIDDKGRSLKAERQYNADISVYHPDTKYIHGRPDWQVTDDKRTESINHKITIGLPCLAFVYRAGEDYEKAVPTDVIEIKNKEEDIHIILEKKQKNVIVLLNPKGEQQIIFE